MRLLLFILLLACYSIAAFVSGDIYTSDLNELNKTFVKIEGEFSYQLVLDKGNYSVFLPEGDYKISASHFDENGNIALHVEEQVKVGTEDQKIDLVLKPVIHPAIYIGFIIAVIIILFLLLQKKPIKQVKKQELDDDAKKVMQTLVSFEGRSTQKELRQTLNFSDAKLSLIIAELEELGYIKKFKRGRGNIIKKI